MAFEESLEIDRGLAQAQQGSMQAQRDLSVALNRAGGIRDARGDLDGAAMAFEESLEIDRGLGRRCRSQCRLNAAWVLR